ncbi:three component ABC system middle component [Hymenobacter jejuensis]|uniref:Uncharacterized protein n=1 Tax=Hymenobacter jejuensis TaxID=2502781 RepID=A0A5B7ZWN8_9BACT|nr:three component ABC system middle component [Hymenobacter jejuensis]QDA59025.1 hypothetical protein FHG12_02415 [Hymenobacter jejuensis]
MIAWEERPVEVANLLNPAFCSLLVRDAVDAYTKKSGAGMDFPLAFLVLPIILHKATRNALPGTTISKFHVWFQNHQELRIGFSARAQSMVPFTKEAIIFAMQRGALAIDEHGLLIAPKYRFRKINESAEMTICHERASFLGKWFSAAGSASHILTAWGISLR